MFRISKEENILFSSLEPDLITEEQAKITTNLAILTEKLALDCSLADRQDWQNKKLASLMEQLQIREAGDYFELAKIDLTGIQLPAEIDLSHVNLIRSRLIAVKMKNAYLQGSNLFGADLSKADLSNAKLNNALL